MSDPVPTASRAVAEILAPAYGPQIRGDVEAALYVRAHGKDGDEDGHTQYTDPVSVVALILQAAEFAWNYYREHKAKHQAAPPAETLTRHVTAHISETHILDDGTRRVVEITVEETIKALPPAAS